MSEGNPIFRMWVRVAMGPRPDSDNDVDSDTPVWLGRLLQLVAIVFSLGAIALAVVIIVGLIRFIAGQV